MCENKIFQRNLYTLLSYLSGWGEVRDYSSTTRRDMIESVLQDLYENNLLSDEIHEEGITSILEKNKKINRDSEIINCLNNMPRIPSEIIDGFDAIFWVDPDRTPEFEGSTPEELDEFYKKHMHKAQLENPQEMFGMDMLTLSKFTNWVRSEVKEKNMSVNEVIRELKKAYIYRKSK